MKRTTCIVAMTLCATIASADHIYWDDPAGGDFGDGANWLGGHVPGPGDAAIFDLGAEYPVQFLDDATIQFLSILDDSTFDLNGWTVVVTSDAAPIGTVHLSGGVIEIDGTLFLSTFGACQDVPPGVPVGPVAGSLTLTDIQVSSGVLLNGEGIDLEQCDAGGGDLVIGAGAILTSGGASTKWRGTVTIDDGGQWDVDAIHLRTTVNIGPGSGMSANDMLIETTLGDLITVSGAGATFDTGALRMGECFVGPADGTIEVLAGGAMTSTNASLGPCSWNPDQRSTGTVVLNGIDTNWIVTGTLTLGDDGVGVVQVTNGASLETLVGRVVGGGDFVGSEVLVSGAGSEWTSGAIEIAPTGDFLTSYVSVYDGGRVQTPLLTVDHSTGFMGSGVLRGNGIVAGQLQNAGLVQPRTTSGQAAGLAIEGSYHQMSGGELRITVGGGVASSLEVVGAAYLSGALTVTGTGAPDAIHTVVSGTGGITGTFDTTALPDHWVVRYLSNSVEVLVGPLSADTNGDDAVDIVDLLEILSAWGPCPDPCPGDVNGDGVVDIEDLLTVLAYWT